MQIWIVWHGGSWYPLAEIATDVEHFDSLKAAIASFNGCAESWNTYYPCVEREPADGGGPSAWIFFCNPTDESHGPGDPYPDRILEYGPRGGLRVVAA
jgi:hypothetical protein